METNHIQESEELWADSLSHTATCSWGLAGGEVVKVWDQHSRPTSTCQSNSETMLNDCQIFSEHIHTAQSIDTCMLGDTKVPGGLP